MPSSDKNVNLILSILEDLDSHVFERMDSSSNSLDALYSKIFGGQQHHGSSATVVAPEAMEATVVGMLCEWATTCKRSGEHRAFVVAKLLERRQLEIVPEPMAVGKTKQSLISLKGHH